MKPVFHQQTRELLRGNEEPRFTAQLDACASRYGIKFPEALVEAYRLAGQHVQNPDWFEVTPGDARDLLVFMYEDQGVWHWAIPLDGTPDPCVLAKMREDPPSKWVFACDSLSKFVYTFVFDYQHWHHHSLIDGGRDAYGKLMVGETFQPLSQDDLSFLRQSFTEEPPTFGLPAPVTYRFSDGWGKRIKINNYNGSTPLRDDPVYQSDWEVSAATEAEFTELCHKLAPRWLLPNANAA